MVDVPASSGPGSAGDTSANPPIKFSAEARFLSGHLFVSDGLILNLPDAAKEVQHLPLILCCKGGTADTTDFILQRRYSSYHSFSCSIFEATLEVSASLSGAACVKVSQGCPGAVNHLLLRILVWELCPFACSCVFSIYTRVSSYCQG